MTREQSELFALFQMFAGICEQNNLHYYLAGGTLLGAVRHHGFIPWDDDIDVIMPFEDYEKFLRLTDTLPPNMTILTENVCERYPFFFCELCNLAVPFQTNSPNGPPGIYIDIFPLLSSRAPGKLSQFLFNTISVIGYVLQVKTEWTIFVPYKSILGRFGYSLLNILSLKQLKRLRQALIQILAKEGTKYCFSPGGGHKGNVEFYSKSWFNRTTSLCFEGAAYPAPAGWDRYLRQLYGDYMVPPSDSGRKSHHKAR